MLERTAGSCIEPASHLFLRRFDPPIRSHRALGPSFWKHGGDRLHVPPWWPLYLKTVRQRERRQTQARLGDRTSVAPTPKSSTRLFTRSAKSPHAHTNPSEDKVSSTGQSGLLRDGAVGENTIASNGLPSASPNTDSLNGRQTQGTIDTEQELRNILERDNQTQLSESTRYRAWDLLNKLPNQEAYATDVFRLLSKFTTRRDQILALHAFALIDGERRTRQDYERAVRVALRADKYGKARVYNAEATLHQLNDGCSSLLLLHAISNRLWGTAASVWAASFEPNTRPFQRLSSMSICATLLNEMDNYSNLASAIHELGQKLCERDPVIVSRYGVLYTLIYQLLPVLVKSRRVMNTITRDGLRQLLALPKQLGQLDPSAYFNAIDTLNKSANRPDKGELADLVYHDLRATFPEVRPSKAIYGSLLSIHSSQGAPADTFTFYLLEFSKLHGAADLMSYQKVLSALAAQGDVDGVHTVFQDLCEAHQRPREVGYYTPLLYAHARLGDVRGAEKEFEKLKDWGIVPNSYCWNILLYAHARSSRPQRALDVFQEMEAQGVLPDAFTFTTLMSIFARTGDTDAVLDLLEQAQRQQVKGDYELIASLIQTYCLNDQADAAERLAEATTKADLYGRPVIIWNYILRHYAFSEDSNGILRVQERMHSLGVKPDDMTYAALMTSLVVLGKTASAAKMLDQLDRSPGLTATAFHHAIVLHGYAQEGQRDSANKIYQQLIEKSSKIGVSPRLAMLHLQGRRDLETDGPPHFAPEYLAELLHELSTEDRASRLPQPGLRRRRAVDAVPSIYLEYLANIMVAKGRVDQADKLIQRYESLSQSSYLNLGNRAEDPIHLLTTRLMISSHRHNWANVDMAWRQILEHAVRVGQRSSAADRKRSLHGDIGEVPQLAPLPTLQGNSIELITNDNKFKFRSMIPNVASDDSPLDRPDLSILPSQQYLLGAPLTRYMSALDIRQLHETAIGLVKKLEKVGFALTTKNWNIYIQVLTRSQEPEHWILAYKIFEEKMMANTPPWWLLRRGKWLSPSPSVVHIRKRVEKRNPGQLMPTYTTGIYLATVLLKTNALEVMGDYTTRLKLWKNAPNTCRFIRRLPYYKDRLQGVLLRGRNVKGDPKKRPRKSAQTEPPGRTGSKSPVAVVPAMAKDTAAIDASFLEWGDTKGKATTAQDYATQPGKQYREHSAKLPMAPEKKQSMDHESRVKRQYESSEDIVLDAMNIIERDLSRRQTVIKRERLSSRLHLPVSPHEVRGAQSGQQWHPSRQVRGTP